MPQITSTEMPLPPFVEVGTLRDMSEVAAKIAVIRRYVLEIKRIDFKLMREGTNDKTLELAMEETIKFGRVCASKADEAIDLLHGIKQGIAGYLRRIQNVPD